MFQQKYAFFKEKKGLFLMLNYVKTKILALRIR